MRCLAALLCLSPLLALAQDAAKPAAAESAKTATAPAAAATEPAAAPAPTAADLLKPKPRPARAPLPPSSVPLQLTQGERIAFIGGSLGEHMNRSGYLETLLHTRFPKLQLVIRNFCRPADAVDERQRPANYTALDDPLKAFGADTFFCFFGFNESFAGPEGVEKFKADYEKFLDEQAKQYPRDDAGSAPRFVLISPAAFERTTEKFLPTGDRENANLALYAAAAEAVAKKRGLAFVELYAATKVMFSAEQGSPASRTLSNSAPQ